VGGPGLVKQRVAARLLLASCTLALGLGLGTAVAVAGVLALRHPGLSVRAPGQVEGDLDRGRHHLFVLRQPGDPGGEAPLSDSRPLCTVTDLRTGRPAPSAPTASGFAAVQIDRSGRHRAACTSATPVTVTVDHQGAGTGAYLAAVGRGLLPAVVLTLLAALLAARALVTAGRLRRQSAS
jgi:hypothetical protein